MSLFKNQSRALKTLAIGLLCAANSASLQAQEAPILEEIIVTAQKREQNLQEIPVAVTAVTGEQLVEYGITDVFDLQQSTPGLIVDQSQTSTTANFSIRGVGTSAQNFGLEPSVGLYVDGVYRSRPSSLINELVDIERVEVLRGPQGTLFGRNTSAGAVLINTRMPSHESDGFLEASAGNLSYNSLNGSFGGSLMEDLLAVRATGFMTQRDGYVEAIGIGDDLINDRDRRGARLQFLYTPEEDLSVRLIMDYARLDELCCAAATLRNNFASFNGQPGSDALLTVLGTSVVSENRLFDDVVAVGRAPRSSNRDKGISAEINLELEAGTVTSISAFRSFDTTDDVDADFNEADVVNRMNIGESEVFSQELRFTHEGDNLNAIVGAYYFTQDLDSRTTTGFGVHADAVLTRSNPLLVSAIQGINAISAATGGLVPMVANAAPPGTSARDVMLQDHQAWALFGQFDFRLSDQLELSAGLRYTDERKELNGTFEQDNTGPMPNFTAIATNLFLVSQGLARPDVQALGPLFAPGWGFHLLPILAPRANVDTTLSDSQLTWNGKLSWFPSDDLTWYAGYTTGFKSGGTNTDRIDPTVSQLFDAESSEAIEVGMKANLPQYSAQINLALHHTTIDDFQTNAFTGTGFNLRNAGNLKARGGELEVLWMPTEFLTLNGAYIYNDTEYGSFERGNCWVAATFHTGQPDPGRRNPDDDFCSRSGDRTSSNPENTVLLSATGTFPLSNDMSGYVHVDYNYRSSIYMDSNIDPLKLQDGFGLMNLRVGLRLGLDLDIALWARNLLNEEFHGTVFDVPLQDGKLNTYSREPRTFGITARRSFQ